MRRQFSSTTTTTSPSIIPTLPISNSADMTGPPEEPHQTTSPSSEEMHAEDQMDIPSWRDSSKCEELIKEITVDRVSPWNETLKGYKLDKLILHQCSDADSETEPTARLFASFTLPEEAEKAIEDKTVWLIIFERIESSEPIPRLSFRTRLPVATAEEYGNTVHGDSNESTKVTSQSLDTTFLPRHIATMFCNNEFQEDLCTGTWLDWADLPRLWECEFGNYHHRHRPDIGEFFLAIDVILNYANPTLEKFVPREHWFPTLLALLIQKVWAKDTLKSSTTSEPGTSNRKKAHQTPIRDPWNENHRELLKPILSDLRHSYKKRLREAQMETLKRFALRLLLQDRRAKKT